MTLLALCWKDKYLVCFSMSHVTSIHHKDCLYSEGAKSKQKNIFAYISTHMYFTCKNLKHHILIYIGMYRVPLSSVQVCYEIL